MNINITIESDCYQWCPRRLRFLCCCCGARPEVDEEVQKVATESIKTKVEAEEHHHKHHKHKDPDDVPRGTKKPS